MLRLLPLAHLCRHGNYAAVAAAPWQRLEQEDRNPEQKVDLRQTVSEWKLQVWLKKFLNSKQQKALMVTLIDFEFLKGFMLEIWHIQKAFLSSFEVQTQWNSMGVCVCTLGGFGKTTRVLQKWDMYKVKEDEITTIWCVEVDALGK